MEPVMPSSPPSLPYGEARMDFNLPEVPSGFKSLVEDAVNAEVAADRAVAVKVLPRAEALSLPVSPVMADAAVDAVIAACNDWRGSA